MSRLPFEIGYASQMSESEMYDLDTELDRIDFWRQDEIINGLVDRYMKHFWRQSHVQSPGMAVQVAPSPWWEDYTDGAYATTVHNRVVDIRVPDALSEQTARLLVDMQLREQLFGLVDE